MSFGNPCVRLYHSLTQIRYRHGVISNLIEPTLLQKVRSEIQDNLSFTPKETDIYKIHQSGDLANLDGLDDASLKLLPSLKILRDALYSQKFRDYLCQVTGAAHVSGEKTDMSINVYTPGCHLLCHDDVIGSRRISYILYLTNPEKPWKEEWGGALRLYPTDNIEEGDGKTTIVPRPDFTVSIPPAFNQLSFFAVQPGRSFHDVEEVYAAKTGDEEVPNADRVRMAISGWYHVPQEGEEGYKAGEEEELANKSSLTQLQGKNDVHDRPKSKLCPYQSEPFSPSQELRSTNASSDELSLSEQDLDFLLKYISPTYLTPDTLDSVSSTFGDECTIVLEQFLERKFSHITRTHLESLEKSDSDPKSSWDIARPPHKHHYLYHRGSPTPDSPSPLEEILTDLVPSQAFCKWLKLATGQIIRSHDSMARRFRRGKDYTLAQSYDNQDPRVEMCLSLTPSLGWGEDAEPPAEPTKNKGNSGDVKAVESEEQPEVGGYLAYMAGDDDDEDGEGSNHGVEVPLDMSTGGRATKAKKPKADPAIYQAEEDEDDGVLFNMPASWNKLGLVLRDQGTMRFVKYVSQSAKGDRWDVFGEFEIEDEGDNGEEDTTIHEEDDPNDDDDDHENDKDKSSDDSDDDD